MLGGFEWYPVIWKEMFFRVLSNTFLLNTFSQGLVLDVCTSCSKLIFVRNNYILYSWFNRKENVFRNCYAVIRIVFTVNSSNLFYRMSSFEINGQASCI